LAAAGGAIGGGAAGGNRVQPLPPMDKRQLACHAVSVKKLNVGCGHRYANGWVNIDFHSEHPEVQWVNLLQRLPFADGTFDVVYSSHVLEHFAPATAEALLRECHRVLKPGGLLRTVLPDLETACREYIRLLEEVATSETARRRYEWIILELLDQLTRTQPVGLIGPFRQKLMAANDQEMIAYVHSRTDTIPWTSAAPTVLGDRLRALTWNKLRTKLVYAYIGLVKRLLPPSLRATLIDDTHIGEKHKWMYDRHSLAGLLDRCGFGQIVFLSASESQIPGFADDHLDTETDGRPYKPGSLFSEATKK
jgi:SAM-dependent methyltransferase